MELPFKGRSTIKSQSGDIEISIPSRKNWFVILFMTGWLGGWLMGEFFAITMVFSEIESMLFARVFIFFWLIAWTVGGYFVIKNYIWSLAGKEVIIAGHGELTIKKSGLLFSKPKTYNLNESKNFRVKDESNANISYWGRRSSLYTWPDNSGKIYFDYGLMSVSFASEIDLQGTQFVLDTLSKNKILTTVNFTALHQNI